MEDKKVSILGTEYDIKYTTIEKDIKLSECGGYCDFTIKAIRVLDNEPDPINSLTNLDVHKRKVARHEIVHAFLIESGLDSQSDWATNEEMVDYFARQLEKIYKACKDADVLEEGR